MWFPPSEEASTAGRQVCARLDPLMTVLGFQVGQVGIGAHDVSVIFCTKYPAFRSRFPRLAPEIDSDDAGACTDLNVTVDLHDVPRLAEVRLDSHGVDELLRDVGRDDLVPRAMTLAEHPLAEGLDQLHGLVMEVFGRAASVGARDEWDEGHGE